jgi:hypothetical protein
MSTLLLTLTAHSTKGDEIMFHRIALENLRRDYDEGRLTREEYVEILKLYEKDHWKYALIETLFNLFIVLPVALIVFAWLLVAIILPPMALLAVVEYLTNNARFL